MSEAAIPVDLFNPGQVFACVGFLEAADFLLGEAEAKFDWNEESAIRFVLKASGNKNPFQHVLEYVAGAEVSQCAPLGWQPEMKTKDADGEVEDGGESNLASPSHLESYPSAEGDRMSLVVRLTSRDGLCVDLGHWTDGSTRNEFKLYAGNRSAYTIASAMLGGTREKPKRSQVTGDIKTRGIATLLEEERENLTAAPLDVLTLMGGSFNMDPRGAWTALDAGYSPNKHKYHGVAASPVVEFMAAWGLEHARPDEYETRRVRYSAWAEWLPPMLARPALAGSLLMIPSRHFHFTLNMSGKNKVITFAQEDPE